METKIGLYPNFPQDGIMFRHIAPLLLSPHDMRSAVMEMASRLDMNSIDVVCGLESRGFIFATWFQVLFNLPQVMIRKASKTPGNKYTVTYTKEYGKTEQIELEMGLIKPGQKVLIVDDLYATGGTLLAASELVRMANGIPILSALIELSGLAHADSSLKVSTSLVYPANSDTMEVIRQPSLMAHCPLVKTSLHELPVLMWHPSLEHMAHRILEESNFRPSYVHWNEFPDGSPNIEFEPIDGLRNRDVVFLMNMATKTEFVPQMALAIALPRQKIRSLTILIPFLGYATHERVDYEGMLATVEPVMKLISATIPHTQTGPASIRIIDIHNTTTAFYVNDNVNVSLMSGIPAMLREIATPSLIIVYPDEGAYKRFHPQLKGRPTIVCSKQRDGNKRSVVVRCRENWQPKLTLDDRVLIVDDLVQSGGTILEVAKLLRSLGHTHVMAWTTHAVFPNRSYEKFYECDGLIKTFYVGNTNPEVVCKLKEPFEVIQLESDIVHELALDFESIQTRPTMFEDFRVFYIATNNAEKAEALRRAVGSRILPVYMVRDVPSGVPSQPKGEAETICGALTRFQNASKLVPEDGWLVTLESGIRQNVDGHWEDFMVICNEGKCTVVKSGVVVIPEEYNALVERSGEETFGSLLEKQEGFTTDWHLEVCGRTRVSMMSEAFEAVLEAVFYE